jgi:molybdopterin-guanine dinucleotide biosynthesis protein A
MAPWFEELAISAEPSPAFAGGPYPVRPDLFPGCGALGGLHAALEASRFPWIFVAACDMPFVVEALVRLLWSRREGHDAVVPTVAGRWEPLCAFYARPCAGPARRALERGERRLAAFFPAVRVRKVEEAEWRAADPAGASFRNLNTPEDYRALAPPDPAGGKNESEKVRK